MTVTLTLPGNQRMELEGPGLIPFGCAACGRWHGCHVGAGEGNRRSYLGRGMEGPQTLEAPAPQPEPQKGMPKHTKYPTYQLTLVV